MEYPRYRECGYRIGSGAVEGGGCKDIVCDRLKRTGMRWSKEGAHQVMQVRAALLSGTLQRFWDKYYDLK
jgi:hypothetical protein